MRSFWGATKPPPGTAIDPSHPLSRGLVGAWLFNEGAGVPRDGRLGLAAAPVNAPTWAAGPWGAEMAFAAASDQYLNVGNPTALQLTEDITVACGVVLTTLNTPAGQQEVVTKDKDAGGRAFTMDIDEGTNTGCRFYINGGGGNDLVQEGTTIAANVRKLIVGSYRKQDKLLTLYVNGAKRQEKTATTSGIPAATANVLFGRREYTGFTGPMTGRIAFVSIWNRKLSDPEALSFSAAPFAMFQAPVWARLFVPSVPQLARPASDITPNAWHDQAAGTTNLYAVLNEASADDATYIEGPNASATPSEQKVRLAALIDPGVSTGHVLRYRYEKDTASGDTVNLTVTLYAADGTTVIASQQHTNITDTVTAGTLTLSGAQADAIPSADYATGLVVGFSEVKA